MKSCLARNKAEGVQFTLSDGRVRGALIKLLLSSALSPGCLSKDWKRLCDLQNGCGNDVEWTGRETSISASGIYPVSSLTLREWLDRV
jgi:hypothetical protein